MWVIVYDVGSDRDRTRAAKLLERSGVRVQRSVFECRLDAERKRKLQRALARHVRLGPGDSIRFYRLCATCMGAADTMGDGAVTPTVLLD